jgi:hypothetical protein
MVVNALQKGLINLCIVPRASMVNCQTFFFQMLTNTFFSNSDRDFYSENNNVSQVYTYMYNKNTKKKFKKTLLSSMTLCAPFCAKHWRHLCAIPMLLFLICFSS